jgi:putative redox protein
MLSCIHRYNRKFALSIIPKQTTMAQHEIETQWMGKMQFNTLVNGHTIVMDAPARVGGEDNGTIPKPLILTALAGCTGMDVVALLRKSHLTLDDLNLKVSGELSRQQPLEYIAIHVVYEVRGKDTLKNAVLQAISDSQEKICGVSHMLKKALPVTWEVNFNGEILFSNKHTSTIHINTLSSHN